MSSNALDPAKKQCKVCEQTKLLSEFPFADGYPRYLCSACYKAYQREKHIERKRRKAKARGESELPLDRKVCSGCGKEKMLDEFYAGNARLERASKCAQCQRKWAPEPVEYPVDEAGRTKYVTQWTDADARAVWAQLD